VFDEDNKEERIGNVSEFALILQLMVMGIVAAWAFGGNCEWAPGLLAAIGLFAPILYLIHNSTNLSGGGYPKLKYLLFTLPVWLLLIVTGLSAIEELTQRYSFDGGEFFAALAVDPLTPAHVAPLRWVGVLMLGGIYLSAFNLMIIPGTRISLRMLLRGLCVSAIALAFVGWISWALGLRQIFSFIETPTPDFFAVFPSANLWCYFALLWLGVLGAFLVSNAADFTWKFFVRESAFPLVGILVLGSTIVSYGTPLQILLAGLLTSVAFCLCAWQAAKKNQPAAFNAVLTLIAVGLGVTGIIVAMRTLGHENIADFLSNENHTGGAANWQTRLLVWDTAKDAVAARPWWGWGQASFGVAVSFFQNAQLGGHYFGYAFSSLLQFVVEKGVLMTAVWVGFPLLFVLRFLKRILKSPFAIMLLVSCAALAFCGVIDYAFQSPALAMSWWIIFFAAIRWARLENRENRQLLMEKSQQRKLSKNQDAGPTLLRRNVPVRRIAKPSSRR